MRALVLRHINGLESATSMLTRPPYIVVMVESNLGLEAAHIANMVKDKPRCINLTETGPEGRFGVLTTNNRKLEFVALLEQQLLQNSVFLCERLICDDQDHCVSTLKKQLLQYRMVSSEANCTTVFNNTRTTYSGKVSEDGRVVPNALQDDLCIALQLACFWSSYVLQRKCQFLDYNRFFDAI